MIFYRKAGNGYPVVLLHGFPNDGTAWDTIQAALAHKYLLLIPDLPGAGKSPLPATALTLGLMAGAIKEMLEAEKIEKAIIAGHSMGGYTALEFASMYPQNVAGISLVHSSAFPDTEEKKETRKKAIQLILKGDTEKETFLRAMAANLFAPSFIERHPDTVNKIVRKGMELPGENLAAFYTAIMQRTDKTKLLLQASFPVHFIAGDEDTAVPVNDVLAQCHLAQVSKISLYKSCGHMSMEEMPATLTKDLLDFFRYCL